MTAKEGENGTVVTIPGSVTDLARGLRELIACLRDLATFIGDGGKFVAGEMDARRSRSAAKNLDALAFPPSGSRHFLERIAAGSGTPDDVTGIDKMLDATACEVECSIQALRAYRDTLRETFGMGASEKLDQVIYGKFGKNGLRRSLARIVEIGCNQNTVPEESVLIASEAMNKISDLNERIAELHDMVLAKIQA